MEQFHFEHEKICSDPIRHRFKEKKFRCPDCVDEEEDSDHLCLSDDCPDRLPQPKFPSPNSSLSDAELHELMECIEEVNQFLRDIGNPRDPNDLRALQLQMQKLRNQFVKVSVNCGMKRKEFKGGLADAGRDFILLNDFEKNTLIPFGKIDYLKYSGHGAKAGHEKELLDINPCLRLELILNFSETVSKSPYLINLFYGLSMKLYLVSLIGCTMSVSHFTDEKYREIHGKLAEINSDSAIFMTPRGEQKIDLENICFIVIHHE